MSNRKFDRNTTVALNDFVRRQTLKSRFGCFTGTDEALLEIVREHLHLARPGATPGSWLVPVPPAGFLATVRRATPEDTIIGVFSARKEGEAPFITPVVRGPKAPAAACDVVVFERAALGNNASTDAAVEIVSINAKAEDIPYEEPMSPVTLWRNMSGAAGGSKANYSVDLFLASINYWKDKVMIEPEE